MLIRGTANQVTLERLGLDIVKVNGSVAELKQHARIVPAVEMFGLAEGRMRTLRKPQSSKALVAHSAAPDSLWCDVTQAEGDGSGTTAYTLSVNFLTADGTSNPAITGGDFTAASGALNFAGTAGETKTITVNVAKDDTVELDETFFVNLSNLLAGGRDVSIGDGQGLDTIQNDDSAVFTVNSQSGLEDAGTMTFTVTLSNPVDTATSVKVSTIDGSATIAGSDYTAVTNRTLDFAAGVASTTFTVTPTADNMVESHETFTVRLSDVVHSGRAVTASSDVGTGTIINDDIQSAGSVAHSPRRFAGRHQLAIQHPSPRAGRASAACAHLAGNDHRHSHSDRDLDGQCQRREVGRVDPRPNEQRGIPS